ncbi:MAG: TIGR04222 domain-containing membrane protein [Pyrinomonadaceae bacterium]|nr:TIGR04222 domain-containing membrane protein [Pyrinomonadaceae bacterium]
MNFLFDNPLANMPGPMFLVLYGAIIFFSAIVFYLYKSKLDWTANQPVPLIPPSPDPFEIAYLRGGENEFARTLVFSLTQKGFLKITNEGKKSYIVLTENQPNWTTLTQVERNALRWFQQTRETKDVFESWGLIEILKPYSTTYEQKATQNNLLMPEEVSNKIRLSSLSVFGLIALFGGYKLVSALLHGHWNIIFLIIFIFAAFLIFWFLGKSKRLSQRGEKYLEGLQNTFEKLRVNPKIAKEYYSQSLPALNAVDPLLLAMGIYGTSVLVGNGFSEFEQAFHRAHNDYGGIGYYSHTSCSSGCGSSCSSGDGGSSCSGGSSCGGGGGCGGCGGGGCGG